MNDHPVHRDDITAMNRQGDLKAYMRGLIRPTRTRTPNTPAPRPTRRRPGTWPAGTQPPGPPPDWNHPPETWAQAVQHYRNTETRPDQPCDCGNCPDDTREKTP